MNSKIICNFIIITVLLFSCKNLKPETIPAEKEEIFTKQETSNNPAVHTLTLLAAGDNLYHETILKSTVKNEHYDFTPIYTEVKDIIKKAGIAFINQETVMAGESFEYSGFPNFNTPQVLAQTLADTGFDILNIANNHTWDMGKAGLLATLDFLDTIEGITVIGARKTGKNYKIITKNNITMGFLSYTFGLNGYTLPADSPNLVSLIDRKAMAKDLAELRPLCDFLIVSMHWGEEYRLSPGPDQISLAAFLAEHNVDIIIGHHPHVLQPFEIIARPDGKETFCFYSLGNFVSNQREKERVLGAFMIITLVKKEQEPSVEDSAESSAELSISDPGLLPFVCHFEQSFHNTKAIPLYLYSEEMAEKHWIRAKDDAFTMDFFYTILNGLKTKIIMHDPF